MDTDQDMIDRNTRWTLIGGLVICPSCLRGQPQSQAAMACQHQPCMRGWSCQIPATMGNTRDVLDSARGVGR